MPVRKHRLWIEIAAGVAVFAGLWWMSRINYLLFHAIAEVFSIVIACSIFTLVWLARRYMQNHYFLVASAGLFCAAIFDLLHTLAYSGMGVFPEANPNLATQLWIAARLFQSILLLLALGFVDRTVRPRRVVVCCAAGVLLILLSIFAVDVFPMCYETGVGLTPFKVVAEYAICALLGVTFVGLIARRESFEPRVLAILCTAILVFIASELTFSMYLDVYGISNLLGHVLKILAFYLLYKVVLETSVARPYELIFRDLKERERELVESREREKDAAAVATAARTAMATIDAMGEGIALLDLQGTVTSVNPALTRLTGLSPAQIQGRDIRELVTQLVQPERVPEALALWDEVLAGRSPSMPPFVLRVPGVAAGRVTVIPSIAFIRTPHGDRSAVILTLRDVTQLTAVQEELKDSEEKYRTLVESANSIIMRRTPDGIITFFNEYAQKFFGYGPDEINGMHLLDTIVPETESSGRDLRRVIRAIGQQPEIHGGIIHENVTRGGTRVWVQWSHRALRNDYGDVQEILCVGTDMSARIRAQKRTLHYQQRLRSMARQLMETEDQERWRLSRHIHDTVIQNLSLSNIRLGGIRKRVGDAGLEDQKEEIAVVRELIDASIRQSRELMADLTPPLLYELGLGPALSSLAEDLSEQHGIPVNVTDETDRAELKRPLLGLLFHSTRELIVNALKHGGDCRVDVTLQCDGGAVRIVVNDTGAGFEPACLDEHHEQEGGFGLFNVRERLEGLGGRLDIDSAPGRGTRAIIVVPLVSPTNGEAR